MADGDGPSKFPGSVCPPSQTSVLTTPYVLLHVLTNQHSDAYSSMAYNREQYMALKFHMSEKLFVISCRSGVEIPLQAV